MGPSDEGMVDVKPISTPIKIGDGKSLTATKTGKKKITIQQADGSTYDALLDNYKCVPGLWTHLFSITSAMKSGWKLGNVGLKMHLTKGRVKIIFDRIFQTQEGILCGVEIISRPGESASPV